MNIWNAPKFSTVMFSFDLRKNEFHVKDYEINVKIENMRCEIPITNERINLHDDVKCLPVCLDNIIYEMEKTL